MSELAAHVVNFLANISTILPGRSALFSTIVCDELLEKSPFYKVQMPRLGKKILEALSPADIHAILRSCISERDKALCLFLLDSGVRAS